MAYSSINKTNWGYCTQCPATNVACVKVKKDLVCILCHRRNKGQEQVNKAQEKEKLRRGGNTSKVSPKTLADVRKLSDRNNKLKTKSELLREADRLFSLFIRNRDSDKNGNIACVCCSKIYNVEDKDGYGNKIVQNLHFIQRDVYSLRFDEDNCSAGCCYCNKDMNDNVRGRAYIQYLSVMIDNLGEEAVKEMQLAHRKINKIDEQMLKTIIEHYSN